MNNNEILKYLFILNIKTKDQLIKDDLNSLWQKKFKQIQSNKKITNSKKNFLLIELNDAKDKLDNFEIKELLKILPENRKQLNNTKKYNPKQKEVLHNEQIYHRWIKILKMPIYIFIYSFAILFFVLGVRQLNCSEYSKKYLTDSFCYKNKNKLSYFLGFVTFMGFGSQLKNFKG